MGPETVTIAQIKADTQKYIAHFVKIENVTLGTYNGNTTNTQTIVTDSTGNIGIYKPVAYQPGVAANDVVDLYAMVACNGITNPQLYTGTYAANGSIPMML